MTLTTSAGVQPPAARMAAEVLQHLLALGDGVVASDQVAVGVRGGTARDEQEAVGLDGVAVVADRLGDAGRGDLTTQFWYLLGFRGQGVTMTRPGSPASAAWIASSARSSGKVGPTSGVSSTRPAATSASRAGRASAGSPEP